MASSSSSLPSWFTSLTCSTSLVDTSNQPVLHWLGFLFLSPCPQRALSASIDVLFFLLLLAFLIQKLISKTPDNKPHVVKTSYLFLLPLILTAVFSISYIVLSILAFTKLAQSPWELKEAIYRLIKGITHFSILIFLAYQKSFRDVTHHWVVRIYWILNVLMVGVFTGSTVMRMTSVEETKDLELRIDDIVTLISIPVSLLLLIISIYGSNGVEIIEEEESRVKEPLLRNGQSSESDGGAAGPGYGSASFISKLFWIWLNPLLQKGYKSPLKIEDIPPLAPEHSAEETSKLFEAKFPTPDEKSEHPVRVALFRCFWKDLVFTGFLAIIRLSVMYMGPVLLQGFVNFASGNGSSPYEGLYLCAALLSAKFVEVLSAHQFNFQSQRVGMLIRSSLITSLYKKGLRLSSSSRQAHGIGQIVNYMAVDAQQLSDMVMQLHNVWLMPCQVLVALTLLYRYLGLSALGALLTVVLIMLVVALNTVRNNGFQMKIMMLKDSRMKATTEMLNNMRVIKFQAWEEHFNNKIQQSRDDEYHWLSKFVFGMTTNIVLLFNTPVIVATVSFGAAILLGIPLNAGTVFSSTAIFRILQEPINSFPQALMSFSQAMISLGRLDKYLKSKELVEGSVERVEGCSGDIAIEVSDGVFGWDDESGDVCLKNLNLTIKKGELAAIVGTVGSGKSSLLASILGEMHKISGKVRVCGSTAYVAQTSWIQNGTIQDNILFNSPMDINRYREVIKLCSLDKDLEMMEFGDQTEIGERGINLSGGQKQRIQLARAVYQDCDIYLLDDVFSAVDAHTGSDLFKDCIRGALKNKTILLVTHQVDFLHNVDHIFVMRDGMIVQSGKYDDLNESGLDFRALVAAHETSMELVDVNEDEPHPSPKSPKLEKPASPHPQLANGGDNPLTKSKSKKATAKIIEEEERESGTVSLNVYKEYSTEAFGWCGVLLVLVMTVLWQGFLMAGDYWLAYETNEVRAVSFNPFLFIQVYAIIALFSCVMALVRNLFVSYVGLRTSQIFFNKLLHSISHAPMSFFDTTPSGRVLSRASTDQINLDLLLPFFMGITVTSVMSVLSIIVVTCQVAWPTIFLVIPLVWCNFWYRGYFLTSSRELTRLDSITKAPVIHHFSESVTGVTTIRSFQKVDQFCQENVKRANANLSMYFHNNGTNEWLGFRLEMIGSLFLCLSALFMVLLPSNIIKPELVGLSLSYGLSLNSVIYFALYISCSVENRMISVERLKQFINIPSEAPWRIKDCVPSPDWPTHGDVDIQNLQVRYRPNTPLILKGLTLFIRGGEKIGVVGRTGSGKSTLIQALFRVMEPSGGNITIDGVDITKLGLHDLRTRFGIIPQEPVLFRGTVRSNIDPIGQYSDEEIWKSLERCQLGDVVSAKPDKLDASVADSGDNWSVGQRQLLCLGRVMLKRSRILFMDEATASVDSQTDGVIQRIIREEFAACTIISIAHRIPTVMDCDKVLVVDKGRAAELDKPSRLIEQHSLFAALVQEYASRSAGL